MDRNRARKLIAEHVPPIVSALQLQEWDILYRLERLSEPTVGSVDVKYPYRRACLYLDVDSHADCEDEFVDTLRHELLHITHAHWDHYWELASELVPEEQRGQMRSLYAAAAELHVRLVQNLVVPPDEQLPRLREAR